MMMIIILVLIRGAPPHPEKRPRKISVRSYGIRVRNVQPHASHLTKWVLPSDFIVRVSFMSHLQIIRFNRENLHGMEREVGDSRLLIPSQIKRNKGMVVISLS